MIIVDIIKNTIIFESDNIYFVKINKDLIDDYLKMVNNPEVSKFISLKNRSFTYDEEIKWIEDKLNNKKIVFSMVEKGSNKFIGNIELLEIKNKLGEFAICITPSMQNKHYGSESIIRFIKYCFEELELENIELSVYSHNEKAINLYKKLGFVEYKRDVNIGIYNNKNIDDIYMKLNK